MAIYVTGDTHGAKRIGMYSVDGFMPRFNMENFPEQKQMTKDDFVVICGDFGGVWASDRSSAGETKEEKYALDWLDSRSFTTLFVPGNHENYDRLVGGIDEKVLDSWLYSDLSEEGRKRLREGYPKKNRFGGSVREIRPSVLMLERGEIFEIDGCKCFAFGGARSHDISDGILRPSDYPDQQSFRREHRRRQYGMIRVENVSWWEQEMPSGEEMRRGLENIRRCPDVDFIFTHDTTVYDKKRMGMGEADELNIFLEKVAETARYGKWFFGHYHDNREMSGNRIMLYEQVIRIR